MDEYVVKCKTCGDEFDALERINDVELDEFRRRGVLAQVRYCSMRCKRKINNQIYYGRYQDRIKTAVKERKRKRKVTG